MSSVQFNHHQAMLSGLDSNKNNKLEELQVSSELKTKIDSNQDGELALDEVKSALQADQIDIQGTQIVPALRKDIQIVGLDRMQNIHTILDRSLSAPHVWAPRVSDNIEAAGELIGALAGVKDDRSHAERRADENRRLNHSSTAYLMAVSSMRSTLHSVVDITANATDSKSKALHAQAKSALSSSAAWTAGSLVGGLIFGDASAENTAIQLAYNSAKNTMVAMRAQTKDLPDPAASLKSANQGISNGFNHLNQLKQLEKGADQRVQQLHTDAKAADAKVTGRTKPFAITGLVVGAVGGAAAGYFLNGNSLKSAAIGAGIGAGASAGLGAIIGGSMDKHYTQKAASLRELAGTLKSYDSAKAEANLQGESLKLYQQHLSSAGIHDLDQATVLNNEIQGTQQRVKTLDQKLEQVLKIYETEKK